MGPDRARLGAVIPIARSRTGLTFPLFGTPVTVDASFVIFSVLIGWVIGTSYQPGRSTGASVLLGAAVVAMVFVSILWHELGHAIALRAFGHRSTILIHGFGGLTSSRDTGDLDDGQSIVVSLAGPFAGIILGFGALAFSHAQPVDTRSSTAHIVISLAVWINLVWSVANLAPILPLDGGHVMERLVHVFAPSRVDTLPHYISLVVAVPLVVVAIDHRQTFAAVFVGFFALGSWRALAEVRAERRRRVADAAATLALDAHHRSPDVSRSIDSLTEVIGAKPSEPMLTQSRLSLAWALTYRNGPHDHTRITALLAALGDTVDTALIAAADAWRRGESGAAFALWTRALTHEQTPPPRWYFPRLGVSGDVVRTLLAWIDQLPTGDRAMARRRLSATLQQSGMAAEAAIVASPIER